MSVVISNASLLIALSYIDRLQILKQLWKKGIIEEPLRDLQNLKLKGFWISDRLFDCIRTELKAY